MTSTTDAAYVECESITRNQARNFYYGIRLLPRTKRAALCALYALARRIDDIGDDDHLAPSAKTAALAQVRKSLGAIDTQGDAVLVAVADAARHYPVPLDAFEELIDGVEMDLAGVRYDDFADLTVYCHRVAGSIGRLCLAVFGSHDDPRAPQYADQLGIALQQTNILRDIREDLLMGRVYLPSSELAARGVRLELDDRGDLRDDDARLAGYIEFAADRAERWYDLGLRLLPDLDGRSAASCCAMAGIYHGLLHRIREHPTAVYDRRLSLPAWQKGAVAMRSLMKAAV